ncbi:MAG: FAD-dependent thymidylate synthase [Candidatus Neomarinimicrobiota bacterium]|nr:MAG: FAD-dependent thymidylate synthase [Candidatus Neomarinimicrobiota bacterium]
MAHVIVPEAEAILDKEFKVLDHGFVRLVDYMGGDSRIVQSARVSYGEGTKTVREDKVLIDYLMSHRHTSPFEQVVLTFHCKMPIFVARQWIRHRTARVNEISGRYSIMTDEFYIPNKEQIGYQSKDNRQGRDTTEVPAELQKKVIQILIKDQERSYQNYKEMIDDNIARELARINLPLSLYTQWYWQIDLHNLFHFLELRLDYHAQWEIQQYGKVIAKMTKTVAPMAYEAFEKHVLNAIKFSGRELEALKNQLQGKDHSLKGIIKTEYEEKIKKIATRNKK